MIHEAKKTEPISNPEVFSKIVALRADIAAQADRLRYRQRLLQGYSARRQQQIEKLQDQHRELTAMLDDYAKPNPAATPIPDSSATILANYTAACRQSDSIRDNGGDICQVFPGNNDGYFIEAFGKTYRFASIEDPATIAKLFVDIVAIGPVDAR